MFVPVERRPEARTRLYVFPHAGGGPGAVAPLAPLLPPEIEPWALDLPGRQARLAEPPRTDLEPLADDMAAALAGGPPGPPGPYALFGYCSGALLAYLACRRLDGTARPPVRLLVGSFSAPDVAVYLRRLPALPSGLFWERLLEYGGVPEEVAAREELRPVLEPALRADFGLLAGYRHRPGPPMATPVTVLYGRDDDLLTRGGLLGWRRQTAARPALRELPASHWLMEDAPGELAAALAAELAAPAPA